jgi:hypothetical protein
MKLSVEELRDVTGVTFKGTLLERESGTEAILAAITGERENALRN